MFKFPFVLFLCVWQVCLQFPKGFFLNLEEYKLRGGRREHEGKVFEGFEDRRWPHNKGGCSVFVFLLQEADGMDGPSFIKYGFYRIPPCPASGNQALEN